MKKTIIYSLFGIFCLWAFAACGGDKDNPTPDPDPGTGGNADGGTTTVVAQRNGESGITYQLLVYSFADSDGDGCGDFNGITSKLDYLDSMGVHALWLSPIHPASSYHGYDVLDYEDVNPDYGTEDDFKNLLTQAHSKNIKVYIDFVLNHTSKDHPWFLDAKSSESSQYRDYYIFSSDPQADIKAGNIPMIASEGASGYDSGQWFSTVSGGSGSTKVKFTLGVDANKKPKTLKVEEVDNVANTGSQNTGIYLYYGDAKMDQFYSSGASEYTLSLDLTTDWGVLVRTSTTSWDGGTKYGAPASNHQLQWGVPLTLSNSDAQDILMPGAKTIMFHSHFWTSYFADLNYGSAATCENSNAFKAVTKAADKWINMGVDGFRLDAVKHIYHNANSDENPTFLKKFYDHCNATYKAAGHSDNIYMVGEVFSEASEVAPYYKGLPALFEFSFWWRLKDAINNGKGSGFFSTISGYRNMYSAVRSDYIEATKLSNHDENRAGQDLGKNKAKMKLAGAVLLTAGGEPYIYQGEELGYWGSKDSGDEYVRTPILWTSSISSAAFAKIGDKYDKSMLSSTNSVESQEKDASSVLSVYRKFGQARDSFRALSKGSFEACNTISNDAVAAWYRTYGNQKVLVIHNFSAGVVNLTLDKDKLTQIVAQNGNVTVSGSKLTLGSYSSVVFLQ